MNSRKDYLTRKADSVSDYTIKRCSRCRKEKPVAMFSVETSNKDGRNYSCKECVSKYKSERWRRLHPEKVVEYLPNDMKRCSKCRKVQPTDEFSPHKAMPDGKQPRCKACRRQDRRRQYAANPESIRRQVKAYQGANPETMKAVRLRRKARKLALPDNLTSQDWLRCLEYWCYCCAVCGGQLRDLFGNVEPHADHWIPLSYKGGDNPGTVPENMICLCNSCNLSKHDKPAEDWLIDRFGKKKAAIILKRIETYFAWAKEQCG